MSVGMVCIITLGILFVASILLAIATTKILNKSKSIELMEEKFENSDTYIKDAMTYLKITNKWK